MDNLDLLLKDETQEEFEARLAGYEAQKEELQKKKFAKLDQQQERLKKFQKLTPEPRFTVKSGYEGLDSSIGGFESRRTYILGGLNKSGKSTLMMNFLDNMIVDGVKVGVVDTELGPEDFIQRFCAVSNKIHECDPDNTPECQKSWNEALIKSGQVNYCYKTDILEDGVVSVNKVVEIFTQWKLEGTQVFVIDNITTIQNSLKNGQSGYEALRYFMDTLIEWAKTNNIILFLVLHTKGAELKFTESAEKINQLIQANDPHRIFEKSVSVNTRPSTASLYGGQSIISQVSGGIMLLWRPFQDFKSIDYQKMAMLILEDWRSKPRTFANEIELEFEVGQSRYYEAVVKEKAGLNPQPYWNKEDNS